MPLGRSGSTEAIGASTNTSSTAVWRSTSTEATDTAPPSTYGTPSITVGGYHAGIEQEACTASANRARRTIRGRPP